MLRIRSEVGKNLEMDRHAVAAFQCINAGANDFLGRVVCRPRTRFDITRVELYSVVKVAAGVNVLNVCVGLPGVAAKIVAAADPNAIVLATLATIAGQPDIPRRVRMTLVDNAAADLVVSATVTGLDQEGKISAEVLTNAVAGTGATTGIKRFKEVRSVVLVISAGAADALDTFSLDTVDEGVIAQINPDTLTAGAAPAVQALLGAAYDIPANTPVWVQLVTDNGSALAPPDLGVVVHWQPYMGGYDGEVVYGGYE